MFDLKKVNLKNKRITLILSTLIIIKTILCLLCFTNILYLCENEILWKLQCFLYQLSIPSQLFARVPFHFHFHLSDVVICLAL